MKRKEPAPKATGAYLLLAMCVAGAAFAEAPPWPAAVPGFIEPRAGEHPRLFFRKADVPALRERARTPEGQKIVARLRHLLGNNGEALPEHWNDRYPVNIGAKGPDALPVGAFTFTHPAGYGMLYQLTGERKYADLARQGLERMFDPNRYSVPAARIKQERPNQWQPKGPRWDNADLDKTLITFGQPDRDERYTWTRPGASLRVGVMMAWVAFAYDLCYDAWDDDFRQRVVREILDYDHLPVDYDPYAEGHKGTVTIEKLVNGGPFPPQSNHFGAYIGGSGIALLAVRHDPGADPKKVEPLLDKVGKQAIRLLTEGFGDHGYFAEGHGPSHMSVNTAFVPFLQAARVAWGRDFITPRPNAQWLTLRWAMEIVPDESGKAWYPNYYPSTYGPDHKDRENMSAGGDWSQGFGALANDDQKAAMLWMYRASLDKQTPDAFDAFLYPHRAALALVNWPIGMEPKNPGQVIGHVNADRHMGHYMFRKSWKDADDLYFTLFLNPKGAHGFVRSARGGQFAFYGLGLRARWGARLNSEATVFEAFPDGSGVVGFTHADGKAGAVAVDYSEKSGALGVVVMARPWFTPEARTATNWNRFLPQSRRDGKGALSFQDVEVDGVPYFVMTIQRGEPPKAVADGGKLRVGAQVYSFDGKGLKIGQ